jgi:hypothetical protein
MIVPNPVGGKIYVWSTQPSDQCILYAHLARPRKVHFWNRRPPDRVRNVQVVTYADNSLGDSGLKNILNRPTDLGPQIMSLSDPNAKWIYEWELGKLQGRHGGFKAVYKMARLPMDIVTIRHRPFRGLPTFTDVIVTLYDHGYKYNKIHLFLVKGIRSPAQGVSSIELRKMENDLLHAIDELRFAVLPRVTPPSSPRSQ